MTGRRALIVVTLALAVVTVARSGHELPVYPSYYPHEIALSAVAPERAGELLLAGKIQAYVGGQPRFAEAPPASISNVASLSSFVVVRVNPAHPSACAAAETVIRDFAGKNRELILHPYPITPLHGDYLHHVDLADAAKAHILSPTGRTASEVRSLKVRAGGALAQSLVRSDWHAQGEEWDVEVVEVRAPDVVSSARYATNGWLGPAWIRSGWFHASQLLRDAAGGENEKRRVEAMIGRLQAADHDDLVERMNLERSLVTELTRGCRALVAGYTMKREYYSTVFTAGIENIGYDSLDGLNSPMFIRTVKLKDFPWNGWLALGVASSPDAAWNPIAGFTDDFGRLMWSAVGDPALLPSPYESAWMLNRITDVQSSAKR